MEYDLGKSLKGPVAYLLPKEEQIWITWEWKRHWKRHWREKIRKLQTQLTPLDRHMPRDAK